MVDTVKLMFLEGQYTINSGDFHYSTMERGVKKSIRNPSSSELEAGVYLPCCTLMNRPVIGGWAKSLIVEFSAPKMLFGNNFEELADSDFEIVVDELVRSFEYLQIDIPRANILSAKVIGWHPSKNIVLSDVFGCKTIINALQGVSASKVYNVQKTDFTDGEVLHFHCNSKDIAFYDKLADLRKGKISDKRAIENHNCMQVDVLQGVKDVSVLRYEIRLNGASAVKRTFGAETTFQSLFSATLSQCVLVEHWEQLTKNIDYLALDTMHPLAILESYLSENKTATPRTALAATASLLIANQAGAGALRKVLDIQFGAHAWRKIKPLIKTPRADRFKLILEVGAVLKAFKPTQLSMLYEQNHIDNSSRKC